MAYLVERLNLRVGDPIDWPKVEPDSVVEVIDPPTGHLVVALKTGGIHAWWGRWKFDVRDHAVKKLWTHHGGRFGWDDIQRPIDQHNAVVEKYLGHEEVVESIDVATFRPRSLRQFVTAVRVRPQIIEVGGRKAWVGEAVHLINQTFRDFVSPMGPEDMHARRAYLEELQRKLGRSTNPYFRSASGHLAEGLSTQGARSFTALRRGEDELLNSIVEMSDIVIGTLQRGAVLESYRWNSENVVSSVYKKVLEAKATWDGAEDEGTRQKAVTEVTNLFGVNILSTLRAQSFRRLVDEIFEYSHIDRLPDLWIAQNYEAISRALTKGEEKLHRWDDRIQSRRKGVVQLEFPA